MNIYLKLSSEDHLKVEASQITLSLKGKSALEVPQAVLINLCFQEKIFFKEKKISLYSTIVLLEISTTLELIIKYL